jgi:SAM-dependent methyltransferase
MSNQWCNDWVRHCSDYWQGDLKVLEVGSRNVNGSPRDVLPKHMLTDYVGVDIEHGPGVDMVVDVGDLTEEFGAKSFDVVISTEALEHMADWRMAVYQMSNVLKINGWLCLTTCSPGFEYHPYPIDAWRFTIEEMRKIFVPPMQLLELDPNLRDLRQGHYSGVAILAQRQDVSESSWLVWWQYLQTLEVSKP